MKVLFILHSTLDAGSTISFVNMIRGLISKGTEVVIVGPKITGKTIKLLINEYNIKYYILPIKDVIWPTVSGWKKILKFPFNLYELIKTKNACDRELEVIAKNEHPDIIHTNVGCVYCGYNVARKFGIPHVWHIREYQDKDFGWKIYPSKKSYIKRLKNSNVVTITKDLLQYFDLSDSPTAQCIYNGILPKDSCEFVWSKDNYFMSANNLSPAKSMDLTIRAFAEFYKTHNNYHLKIFGKGNESYVTYLKQIAVKSGCAGAIEWHGFEPDVVKYMVKARGLIVASRSEGFGRMTAEACFKGCMPIGRNTGGTKEILDIVGGMPFDDEQGLVRTLNEVAKMDVPNYRTMIDRAQSNAKRLFSVESNVESIYNLYIKLIADCKKKFINC